MNYLAELSSYKERMPTVNNITEDKKIKEN